MILKFSVTRTLFLECFILGLLFSCFGSVWWSLFYLRQVGEEANMEEKGPNTAASASASANTSTAVCCVSDKKSSLSNSDSVVVASSTTTSMKQQHSSTGDLLFPSKICMMGMIPHHHHQGNNQDRQFGGGDVDGGGGGCVGPTRRNSSSGGGANEVVVSSTSSSSLYGRDENVVLISSTNLQQAFDIFSSYSYPTTYKPPGGGGMGGANVCGSGSGYPFTSAQSEELERQAMIYKYMISSVPVPPHLLFPLSPNFNPGGGGGGLAHHDPSGPSSPYNVRYSKNGGGGGDPEPGRCKRTDGKKWRCSRDVAPHHKYCERHLHRGRPRSRKPVELKNNNNNVADNLKKTRLDLEQKKPRPSSSISQHPVASNQQPLLLFDAKTDLTISSPPSYNGTTNRDLSLMTETEMAAMDGSVNRWQHLIEPDMGFANEGSSIYGSNSVDVFHQDYIEQQQPFDVFPYSVFCEPEIDPLIRFIDAWSSENLNNSSNGNAEPSVSPNHETLSPSLNLSMAMAVGDMLDREMGNIQMGSGVEYCDDAKDLRHSCSAWEPFARGGPLAEALGPNMGLGPASPHDSISNTATTVSSASEVIQRTLFSNSDGSVCNSPTTLAPSEFVLQWLS